MTDDEAAIQRDVCQRHGSPCILPSPSEKCGIALQTVSQQPLNALRHQPRNGTCGWYIWGGEELSDSPEFFQPLHVAHLKEYCPQIIPFLGLAPGWRVLLADGHEDVWHDETLKDA